MGGTSFKSVFSLKKKKSPLTKAFSNLKRALPKKKSKRKSIMQKLKLKEDKKRRFSLATEKKPSTPLKRLSLGNIRKDSLKNASAGRKEKDGGGLGRVREQIKKKFSKENKGAQGSPVSPMAEKEEKMSKTS